MEVKDIAICRQRQGLNVFFTYELILIVLVKWDDMVKVVIVIQPIQK